MALSPQMLAMIIIAQEYRPDIIRQINRQAALLRMITHVPGAGPACALAVEADGMFTESFIEGADVTSTGSDKQTSGTIPWAQYRSNFQITGLAGAVATTTTTPEGNREIWARNLVNATASLASQINIDLYTGSAANRIVGLTQAIGADDNIYFGIDRTVAANAFFRPHVADPGTPTPLTLEQIRYDLAKIYKACGNQPSFAMVAPEVLTEVIKLLEPHVRFVDQLQVPRGRVALDASYQALIVDGCVFIRDKDCPLGSIFYIDPYHLQMEQIVATTPGLEEYMEKVVVDDGWGPMPFGATYELLAKTGDSSRAMVKCYSQLKVSRPNAFGVRYNVAYTDAAP